MGTKMAPNYANLFMFELESKILENSDLKPKLWLRYIDDIWMIWQHGERELLIFRDYINDIHPTIKFTMEYSNQKMHFLDVMVTNNNGLLSTSLYTKPTDAHLYLSFDSCHPYTQKKSIPYSQALRIRRICSDIGEFNRHTDHLKHYLLARKYPILLIDEAISKARAIDRQSLLYPDPRSTDDPTFTAVTTYHPDNPFKSTIIKQHWDILATHGDTLHIFNSKLNIAYKRTRSLRDILVSSRFKSITPTYIHIGSHPCNKPCVTCPYFVRKTHFMSTSTRIKYKIKQNINCQSHSCIYVIECTKCHKQYVGQTSQTINQRFYGHRQDIRDNNEKTLPRHIHSECPNSDVIIYGIQRFHTNEHILRTTTEAAWIQVLTTIRPAGLNTREESC